MKILSVFLLSLLALLIVPQYANADTLDVNLTWTAPGDDGDVGIAAAYDMRWCSDDSMLLVNSFTSQNQIAGIPAPDTAGTSESFDTFLAFPEGYFNTGHTIYFCIRSVDEAGNWSENSNIKGVFYQHFDVTSPGIVIDLNVTITPR
jgi:hypothetical protein